MRELKGETDKQELESEYKRLFSFGLRNNHKELWESLHTGEQAVHGSDEEWENEGGKNIPD
jgi:hypothetical protein